MYATNIQAFEWIWRHDIMITDCNHTLKYVCVMAHDTDCVGECLCHVQPCVCFKWTYVESTLNICAPDFDCFKLWNECPTMIYIRALYIARRKYSQSTVIKWEVYVNCVRVMKLCEVDWYHTVPRGQYGKVLTKIS